MEHPQVTLRQELSKRVVRHPDDREAQVQLMALDGIIKLIRRMRIVNPTLCYMTALEIIQDVALYGASPKRNKYSEPSKAADTLG